MLVIRDRIRKQHLIPFIVSLLSIPAWLCVVMFHISIIKKHSLFHELCPFLFCELWISLKLLFYIMSRTSKYDLTLWPEMKCWSDLKAKGKLDVYLCHSPPKDVHPHWICCPHFLLISLVCFHVEFIKGMYCNSGDRILFYVKKAPPPNHSLPTCKNSICSWTFFMLKLSILHFWRFDCCERI